MRTFACTMVIKLLMFVKFHSRLLMKESSLSIGSEWDKTSGKSRIQFCHTAFCICLLIHFLNPPSNLIVNSITLIAMYYLDFYVKPMFRISIVRVKWVNRSKNCSINWFIGTQKRLLFTLFPSKYTEWRISK